MLMLMHACTPIATPHTPHQTPQTPNPCTHARSAVTPPSMPPCTHVWNAQELNRQLQAAREGGSSAELRAQQSKFVLLQAHDGLRAENAELKAAARKARGSLRGCVHVHTRLRHERMPACMHGHVRSVLPSVSAAATCSARGTGLECAVCVGGVRGGRGGLPRITSHSLSQTVCQSDLWLLAKGSLLAS